MTHQVSNQTDSQRSSRGRRHPAVMWAGVALLAGGLVIIGYLGWQLVGTNIVSQRHQAALVEQLEQEWSTTPGTELGPDTAQPGEASALVRIPRFGKSYVMPVLEGVGDDELARGFGHFPGSADPGKVGNYALAAHRITHGEPLADMPSLRPGDTVVVETRDAVYTYQLDTDPNDLIVDFKSTWVVAPHPVNPDPNGVQPADDPRLITLVTCSELFHTDNRMVVFGHLVDRQRA